MAVATAMGTQVLGPAVAGITLCLEPEMGSILVCHRHQMTSITTRRLQRGGAFSRHDTLDLSLYINQKETFGRQAGLATLTSHLYSPNHSILGHQIA